MIAESRIRRAGTLPAQPVDQPARRRRLGRVAALGAAAALIISGCSAGQQTQTSGQHPTVGGARADVGDIALRNVQLSAPDASEKRWAKGSNVPVEMSIVNNSVDADRLLSVTTDAAASTIIFPDGAAYDAFVDAQATPAATGSATTPASGETPATTTTTTTTPAAGGSTPATTPINLPAGGSVRFGGDEDGPVVLLIGLKDIVGGGQTVTLSFTFANAGSTDVVTPVDLTRGGYSNAPTENVRHGE